MTRETKPRTKRGEKPKRPGELRRTPPPRDSFQVVIQCQNEDEQERLYNEFRSRELTVRLLTM